MGIILIGLIRLSYLKINFRIMIEAKRLFDCIEHQLKSIPLDDMLAGKENGLWKKYSTKDVANIVNDLSAGLLKAGISFQ